MKKETKILIKEFAVYGRVGSPADKYYDPPAQPSDWDTKRAYNGLNDFMRNSIKEHLKPEYLPPKEFSNLINQSKNFYIFNECIITNQLQHDFSSLTHLLHIISTKDKERYIDQNMEMIKNQLLPYWGNYLVGNSKREERIFTLNKKIVEMNELSENINFFDEFGGLKKIKSPSPNN